MRRSRIVAVSLLCIVLASSTLVGLWALPRVNLAKQYANQFAGLNPVKQGGGGGGAEGTNWELVVYGDPDPAGMLLPLFKHITLENFEWHGTTKDQFGNDIGIDVTIGTVMVDQEIAPPDPNIAATDVDFHLTVGGLVDVLVKADSLSGRIDFGVHDDYGMNALNITAVLAGSVELRVYTTVLPWPLSVDYVLYSYMGERIRFSMVVVKPIDIVIETPSPGARVQGDQAIIASITTAKGISAENVRWEVDGQWAHPMFFDEGDGKWKGTWPSYQTGNGGHNLAVKADGVNRKPGYESRYPREARINVWVDNPWVSSWILHPDGHWEEFGLNLETSEGMRGTRFNFWPWEGYTLKAPEYWWDGKIKFKCWMLTGNEISNNPTLTIDANLLGKLLDGGKAKGLVCVYVPVG